MGFIGSFFFFGDLTLLVGAMAGVHAVFQHAEPAALLPVTIRSMSGEKISEFQVPQNHTMKQVKLLIAKSCGAQLFAQQLVHPILGIVSDAIEVRQFHKPLELQLVLQPLDYEKGAFLMSPAILNNVRSVQQLLSAFAHPDLVCAREGTAALFVAAGLGHLSVVRSLCEAGADKDRVGHRGATPLYQAVQGGHTEVVRYLAAAGADKDKAMRYGATPLYQAAYKSHVDIVLHLCESRADKDKATHSGRT